MLPQEREACAGAAKTVRSSVSSVTIPKLPSVRTIAVLLDPTWRSPEDSTFVSVPVLVTYEVALSWYRFSGTSRLHASPHSQGRRDPILWSCSQESRDGARGSRRPRSVLLLLTIAPPEPLSSTRGQTQAAAVGGTDPDLAHVAEGSVAEANPVVARRLEQQGVSVVCGAAVIPVGGPLARGLADRRIVGLIARSLSSVDVAAAARAVDPRLGCKACR